MTRAFATLILFLTAAMAAVSPGSARQDDSRLNALFERLQATDDGIEARAIEATIWHIWIEADDPAADALMMQGIAAMNGGDLRTALAAFDAVTRQVPDFAEGWNKRATVYYLMGRHDASVQDIARTLALEPRHFGAISGLGLIYTASGQDAEALRTFERALTIHPHMDAIRQRVKVLRARLRGKQI